MWTRALHMSQSTVCLSALLLIVSASNFVAREAQPGGERARPLILCPKHFVTSKLLTFIRCTVFRYLFNQSWYNYLNFCPNIRQCKCTKNHFQRYGPAGRYTTLPVTKTRYKASAKTEGLDVLLLFNQSIN